jgi:hypothetical protein
LAVPGGAQSKNSEEFLSNWSSLCEEGTREESHQALFADAMSDSPQRINDQNTLLKNSFSPPFDPESLRNEVICS